MFFVLRPFLLWFSFQFPIRIYFFPTQSLLSQVTFRLWVTNVGVAAPKQHNTILEGRKTFQDYTYNVLVSPPEASAAASRIRGLLDGFLLLILSLITAFYSQLPTNHLNQKKQRCNTFQHDNVIFISLRAFNTFNYSWLRSKAFCGNSFNLKASSRCS